MPSCGCLHTAIVSQIVGVALRFVLEKRVALSTMISSRQFGGRYAHVTLSPGISDRVPASVLGPRHLREGIEECPYMTLTVSEDLANPIPLAMVDVRCPIAGLFHRKCSCQ